MSRNTNYANKGDTSPATRFFAVTPADDTDQESDFRALFIGSGGNVVVTEAHSGDKVTYPNCYDGQILPVGGRRVEATGTTASNIVALI